MCLGSVIGNELQSSCGCIQDVVVDLLRLVSVAKAKIRSAAVKVLQKFVSVWPEETKAAIENADDDVRESEYAKTLLAIQPSAAVVSERETHKEKPDAKQSVAVSLPADEAVLESKSNGSVTELVTAVPASAVKSDIKHAETLSLLEDRPLYNKSDGLAVASAVSMYGDDRVEGPYTNILDLLNSYVSIFGIVLRQHFLWQF